MPIQDNFMESLSDDSVKFEQTLSKDEVEFLSLLDFHKAWHSAPKSVAQAAVAVQVEEEKKEAPKSEVKVVDENYKKLIQELSFLGFEEEEASAAYNKAKKKDLDSVLDILSEEQEKKKKLLPKPVEKKAEYNIYNC